MAQKIADLNRAPSKKKKKIENEDLEELNDAHDVDVTIEADDDREVVKDDKSSDDSDSDEDEEKTESGEERYQ